MVSALVEWQYCGKDNGIKLLAARYRRKRADRLPRVCYTKVERRFISAENAEPIRFSPATYIGY